MVDYSFETLMRNPKRDEDVERAAESFFLGLYQVIEKTKMMLKDEFRQYFLLERLQLLRRSEPSGDYLGKEYDFLKVSPVAYLRKRALQEKLMQTFLAQLEHSALAYLRVPRECYSERLRRNVEVWTYQQRCAMSAYKILRVQSGMIDT